MTRPLKNKNKAACYHVVNHGVSHNRIFRRTKYRENVIGLLRETIICLFIMCAPAICLANHAESPPLRLIKSMRVKTYEKIYQAIGGEKNYQVIVALVLGYKNALTFSQKKVFRNTGTSHLMAISGMHIGLMAGVLFVVVKTLWKLSTFLSLCWPAKKAATLGALLGAAFYSVLSGFAISTQRALIMITLSTMLVLSEKTFSLMRVFVCTALLSVLCTPDALESYSFWLSYSAVFFILYGSSYRVGRSSKWKDVLKTQGVVTLGLLPFNLFFFHREPLLGPMVNLMAIPLVSLFVLPIGALGTVVTFFSHTIGKWILQCALYGFNLFWPILVFCAEKGIIFKVHNCDPWCFVGMLILAIVVLAPKGLRPVH